MLVESEALREIDYAPATRTLRIRFAEGGWWRYYDVPAAVYDGLVGADSHGRYFHQHIRGRYRYRRDRGAEAR